MSLQWFLPRQAIFSRQDHFQLYYEYFRAQDFHSFSTLLTNWDDKMKMQEVETDLFNLAYASVKKTVMQDFPTTLSGRLLHTIERKSQLQTPTHGKNDDFASVCQSRERPKSHP